MVRSPVPVWVHTQNPTPSSRTPPEGEVYRNACIQPSYPSGADVSRTRDLIIANDALYQLSYRPEYVAEPAGKLGRGQV